MSKVVRKRGSELTAGEIRQIDSAKAREHRIPPMEKNQIEDSVFFLLHGEKKILAMGQLSLIKPVMFNGEAFSIQGIGGIIANEKGKGYGRQIMADIKDYLTTKNLTGVGFCALRSKGFYEKCNFEVDTNLIQRFVFEKDGKRITNTEDDCVLYLDSPDGFMKKVLSAPSKKVRLPQAPDW